MWLTATILTLVTLQRLVELIVSRRNVRRLLAMGGIETGAAHYRMIVAFHAVWLAGLWLFAWTGIVDPSWLAVFIVLQMLRIWVFATLGRRWTTRIITVPGEKLIANGPYRFVRHPNYVVVAGEIFALPMVFGLVWFAIAASVLNAGAMWVRIRAENAALHHSAGGPS